MLSNTLLVAAFAALAAAQSTVLTFTNVPNPITDGQPQAILYATNDTSNVSPLEERRVISLAIANHSQKPVTIILRQGASGNLQDVETLTTDANGGQFIWTPSNSLPNGNNYALQIKQGDEINYFGPFTVQGQSSTSSMHSGSSASASGKPIVSAK